MRDDAVARFLLVPKSIYLLWTVSKMKMNALRNISVSVVSAGLLGLGGCAQLQNFGGSMWTGTKNFTGQSAHKVVSFLRPAPKQKPVFEGIAGTGTPRHDPLVTDFMRRYARPEVENITQLAMNHTSESGVSIYRPAAQKMPNYIQVAPVQQSYTPQRSHVLPSLRPTSNPGKYAQAGEQLAGAVSQVQDASFVKIGGGANMVDWQACQSMAGDIYISAGQSYSVNPAFETCMRGKGYLPESEAVQIMGAQD